MSTTRPHIHRGLTRWKSSLTSSHTERYDAEPFAVSKISKITSNALWISTIKTQSLLFGPPPPTQSWRKLKNFVKVLLGQYTRLVTMLLSIASKMTITVDSTVDQTRVDFSELSVPQPQTIETSGFKCLNKHIAPFYEFLDSKVVAPGRAQRAWQSCFL